MTLRGFAEDHPVIVLTLFLVGLIAVVAALSTIFVQGSILGGAGCSFEPVNVSGQQFGSVDDFRQDFTGNFTAIQSEVEFRTENGVLEYKIRDCEGVQRLDE